MSVRAVCAVVTLCCVGVSCDDAAEDSCDPIACYVGTLETTASGGMHVDVSLSVRPESGRYRIYAAGDWDAGGSVLSEGVVIGSPHPGSDLVALHEDPAFGTGYLLGTSVPSDGRTVILLSVSGADSVGDHAPLAGTLVYRAAEY